MSFQIFDVLIVELSKHAVGLLFVAAPLLLLFLEVPLKFFELSLCELLASTCIWTTPLFTTGVLFVERFSIVGLPVFVAENEKGLSEVVAVTLVISIWIAASLLLPLPSFSFHFPPLLKWITSATPKLIIEVPVALRSSLRCSLIPRGSLPSKRIKASLTAQ